MKKIKINKNLLFDLYIAKNKSFKEISTKLHISVTTIKRRIIDFQFEGIRENLNNKLRIKQGWFWKKYTPNWLSKSYEEARNIKIDYYKKTLIDNFLYDMEKKQFREKTSDEKKLESEILEKLKIHNFLSKNQYEILKNPEKYQKTYKNLILLSNKLHLKNNFDFKWLKECDKFENEENLTQNLF